MSQKITNYPGHEITSDELKEGKYLDVQYKFVPRYSWAAGVAISRFLDELKQGRIFARKCNRCQRILVPPRMYCEQCYRPTDEWVQIKIQEQSTPSQSHTSEPTRDASRHPSWSQSSTWTAPVPEWEYSTTSEK